MCVLYTVGDFSGEFLGTIALCCGAAFSSTSPSFVVALSASTRYLQNAFVQLSLAFRNDKYTLEMRLKQAERERNLTEEDTEKELEEFKGALKVSPPQQMKIEERRGSPTSHTLNVPAEWEHRCPIMSFGCVSCR